MLPLRFACDTCACKGFSNNTMSVRVKFIYLFVIDNDAMIINILLLQYGRIAV